MTPQYYCRCKFMKLVFKFCRKLSSVTIATTNVITKRRLFVQQQSERDLRERELRERELRERMPKHGFDAKLLEGLDPAQAQALALQASWPNIPPGMVPGMPFDPTRPHLQGTPTTNPVEIYRRDSLLSSAWFRAWSWKFTSNELKAIYSFTSFFTCKVLLVIYGTKNA